MVHTLQTLPFLFSIKNCSNIGLRTHNCQFECEAKHDHSLKRLCEYNMRVVDTWIAVIWSLLRYPRNAEAQDRCNWELKRSEITREITHKIYVENSSIWEEIPRAITSKIPLCKRKEYNKSFYSNEDKGQYFLSISPKILSKMEQEFSPKIHWSVCYKVCLWLVLWCPFTTYKCCIYIAFIPQFLMVKQSNTWQVRGVSTCDTWQTTRSSKHPTYATHGK